LRKVKDDYEKIAVEFSATRQSLWEDLNGLGQYVKDGDAVLDLGCGNGRLYELFKGKAINYRGIDNCKPLIEKAQEKYAPAIGRSDERTSGGANFTVGDILDLPFAKNQFDAVFCIAVLHHLPSAELRRKVLADAKKSLKEGGLLILTVWNLYQKKYWRYFFDISLPFGEIGSHRYDSWKDILIPWKLKSGGKIWRYYHAFTRGELRRLVAKAGFQILKSDSSRHNFILVLRK